MVFEYGIRTFLIARSQVLISTTLYWFIAQSQGVFAAYTLQIQRSFTWRGTSDNKLIHEPSTISLSFWLKTWDSSWIFSDTVSSIQPLQQQQQQKQHQ